MKRCPLYSLSLITRYSSMMVKQNGRVLPPLLFVSQYISGVSRSARFVSEILEHFICAEGSWVAFWHSPVAAHVWVEIWFSCCLQLQAERERNDFQGQFTFVNFMCFFLFCPHLPHFRLSASSEVKWEGQMQLSYWPLSL